MSTAYQMASSRSGDRSAKERDRLYRRVLGCSCGRRPDGWRAVFLRIHHDWRAREHAGVHEGRLQSLHACRGLERCPGSNAPTRPWLAKQLRLTQPLPTNRLYFDFAHERVADVARCAGNRTGSHADPACGRGSPRRGNGGAASVSSRSVVSCALRASSTSSFAHTRALFDLASVPSAAAWLVGRGE